MQARRADLGVPLSQGRYAHGRATRGRGANAVPVEAGARRLRDQKLAVAHNGRGESLWMHEMLWGFHGGEFELDV